MTKDEIVKLMEEKPYLLDMGKGLLSRRYNCSKDDISSAKLIVRSRNNSYKLNFPKILLYDIETAPMVNYTFGRFKQNIGLTQTISEPYIICWSAMWFGKDDVFGSCQTPIECINGDDYRVCKELYDAMNEADIIVAYNGKSFDTPFVDGRFFVHGFNKRKPTFIVDPYLTIKHNMRFSSNKMDLIAKELGIETKLETDFTLWRDCMNGKKEALDYMYKYNNKDVVILNKIYERILPYIINHPNVSNIVGNNNGCAKCGSTSYVELKDQYFYTATGKYQLYRCTDCGSIFRGRRNLNTVSKLTTAVCSH